MEHPVIVLRAISQTTFSSQRRYYSSEQLPLERVTRGIIYDGEGWWDGFRMGRDHRGCQSWDFWRSFNLTKLRRNSQFYLVIQFLLPYSQKSQSFVVVAVLDRVGRREAVILAGTQFHCQLCDWPTCHQADCQHWDSAAGGPLSDGTSTSSLALLLARGTCRSVIDTQNHRRHSLTFRKQTVMLAKN